MKESEKSFDLLASAENPNIVAVDKTIRSAVRIAYYITDSE